MIFNSDVSSGKSAELREPVCGFLAVDTKTVYTVSGIGSEYFLLYES